MDESEKIMRRYLLGELSESERSALEEKYFTDPEVFNQVLKTESELVDGYARDQLSKEVRERIEKSYMGHPARADRVKFAEALTTRIDQLKDSVTSSTQPTLPVSWWQRLLELLRGQSPTLRLSMALATLLIVLGGIWFLVETRRRQSEAAQTQAAAEQQQLERERSQRAEDEARRAKELAAEQARVGPSPQPTTTPNLSPQRIVALALTASTVRGRDTGQAPTLVIPPGATQARLELNLKGDDFPTYRAMLQTIAGVEIFSQRNVKPRRTTSGASFAFTLPASKLENGDYVLTLSGISPNGDVEPLSKSLFRVDKK